MRRTAPFDAKTAPIAVRGENCTTRGKKAKQKSQKEKQNPLSAAFWVVGLAQPNGMIPFQPREQLPWEELHLSNAGMTAQSFSCSNLQQKIFGILERLPTAYKATAGQCTSSS